MDTPLPIEKIIVGPHKDKDTRAAALRVRLRNTIEVEVYNNKLQVPIEYKELEEKHIKVFVAEGSNIQKNYPLFFKVLYQS